MTSLVNRLAGTARVLVVFVVLALVAGLVLMVSSREDQRFVTVDFPRTNSLYKGSDVRILGVPVGRVEELRPRGDSVRVKISYPGDVRLPKDVKAVIVSPAIVGDRFVQLAPAYDGGDALPDGARLGVERTEVPVELDQVYESIDELAVALGPEGANKDGAVSDLVDDTAAQLDGQGAQLNETLRNFGKLSQTLSDNKDDLFGSVREVSQFVELLQTNDESVRAFFDSTAEVSEVLEGEREDLQLTLETLGKALIEVRRLVRDNRDQLKGNVENLQVVAEVLGKHQDDLEEVLVSAPTALTNVALTYNGDVGTLDTKVPLPDLILGAVPDLPSVLCAAAGAIPELGDDIGEGCSILAGALESILGPLLDALPGLPGMSSAPLVGEGTEAPEGAPETPAPAEEGAPGGLDSILPRSAVETQPADPVHDSLEDMLGVAR